MVCPNRAHRARKLPGRIIALEGEETAREFSRPPGGGGGSSTAPVYATVTVTNTGPEAEEHIAVAPSNTVVVDPSTGQTFTFGPAMLVAAISDFSLRGGSNTTKYAFSSGNGAVGSW